jgi:predicted RNase H-like nuclease (RuvC/YqgF family)
MDPVLMILAAVISSGAFGGFIAWLLNRKLQAEQTKEVKAKSEEVYARIYSKLLADQRTEIHEWKARYEAATVEFEHKIAELQATINELQELNKEFKTELGKLKQENAELKKATK